MTKKATLNDEYTLIRLKNQAKITKYINLVETYDWSQIHELSDCNEAYQNISDSLKKIYNDSFPVHRVKKRYRNRLPWLNEGLKRSIKHKK